MSRMDPRIVVKADLTGGWMQIEDAAQHVDDLTRAARPRARVILHKLREAFFGRAWKRHRRTANRKREGHAAHAWLATRRDALGKLHRVIDGAAHKSKALDRAFRLARQRDDKGGADDGGEIA